MHSRFRTRGATLAGLLVLAMAALTPSLAEAKPEPGAKRGFRLFARPLGAMTINRVLCGLTSTGNICVDSLNSSTIGGGFWPKGTADQYVFNTGLQLAGIIAADGGPWAGDTTGAFFFDPKGTTEHGLEVRPIYNSTSPADVDSWPDAAKVPCNQLLTALCSDPRLGGAVQDPVGAIYSSLLQGRVNASQGDTWFMSWEGDPGLNAGRPHPLGIVAETRGLGWNFPSGNEDIVYFVYTFYNVTTLDPLAYGAIRPAMADILIEQAISFQALNNALFSVTLPVGGYTIDPLYAAFATDMDVTTDAGSNYASVNLPFALGDTYHETFPRPTAWTFDPAIFSAPFFAGAGFVGVKYLQSPTGPGEIQLYSNTINGGAFGDPQNTTQLYRYLSGNISTAAGDAPCNNGVPSVTRICFVNNASSADMRFFQSSTPLALGPGGFGSIVVAYIFAAPVDGIVPAGTSVTPGDATIMGNAAAMTAGVPEQQRLAGYLGFNDINTDGIVTQDEFVVVPGSLLGKALTAQAVFDAKFLLPFSPESPEFFLIPGDNSVTVMWQQSPSENIPDPFFDVAKDATVGGNVNPLYDPNYREFDVEGYRVYRGRVDAPNELTLLAQFDYAGTVMRDFGGQLDPDPLCAPELGLDDNNSFANCPVPYVQADFAPGVQRTVFTEVQLQQVDANGPVNTLSQVKLGERVLLGDGTALVLISDTAVVSSGGTCVGGATLRCPLLEDNGVPFVFVDNAPLNNFRYFYSVTAFDVNSWQSGPTNLESPRITKAVVPVKPATNYENTASLSTAITGRGVELDPTAPLPTIDVTTGVFSGPMPPADGWDIAFGDFVAQVIAQPGSFRVRLDSVALANPAWGSGLNLYYWTGISGSSQVVFTLAASQDFLDNPGDEFKSLTFPAVLIDDELGGLYGGGDTYSLQGQAAITVPGNYMTNGTGRASSLAFGDGSINEALWNGSFYDGARWFDGSGPESFPNPTGGNCSPNCTMSHFRNAGDVGPAVVNIQQPLSYTTMNFSFREFQGSMGGASRAADMSVYWGAGGTVDSVVDVTHNVLVPFKAGNGAGSVGVGGTWGFLNLAGQSAAGSFDGDNTTISIADFVCLNPFINDGAIRVSCGAGAPFFLESTAAIGQVGFVTTDWRDIANYFPRTGPGFGMYIAGNIFLFETASLPSAGDIWTLRDYMGGIFGGKGTDAAGTVVNDAGDYGFLGVTRPMTAIGVELVASYDVVNQVNRPAADDISNVHPVPDPFYITGGFDRSPVDARIEFINLPQQAIIRIYSSSGVLVDLIEHDSDQFGGSASWDVRNRNNQVVASGVYFYHVEANDQRRVGRMTIVRFAQ